MNAVVRSAAAPPAGDAPPRAPRRCRVLVVDDQASMRRLIAGLLAPAPGVEVIGAAGDAHEARAMIKALEPDVLTLDLEMPGMDGLAFLGKVMALRPMPVVVVSALSQSGAAATLQALAAGAVECVGKPEGGAGALGAFAAELARAVRAAAESRAHARPALPAAPAAAPVPPAAFRPNGRVVAIGASTGGVEALGAVLGALPADCAPTLVVQHMQPRFLASFAARLDGRVAPRVVPAEDGQRAAPGHVYMACAARHLELAAWRGGAGVLRLGAAEPVGGHVPSADALFLSVARAAGSAAVGVLLTGMGRDGADGLGAMRRAGAHTIGQDAATCVVYGMPRAAFEEGAVVEQLPLARIGPRVVGVTAARPPAATAPRPTAAAPRT